MSRLKTKNGHKNEKKEMGQADKAKVTNSPMDLNVILQTNEEWIQTLLESVRTV